MGVPEGTSWLTAFVHDAEEQARRRGDRTVGSEHLALALARPQSAAASLLAALGVDPLDWRDQITTVLGWREGARAGREGRPAGALADSLAELRFSGPLEVDPAVTHILELSAQEAVSAATDVGAVHVLVALLHDGDGVGAATGRWLGMTEGRVRSAGGLRTVRRVVAGGVQGRPFRRPTSAGPMVLCGGAADTELLAVIIAIAGERAQRSQPQVVVVDLGWHSRPPTAGERAHLLEQIAAAGAENVVDSGLTERGDAHSSETCALLAGADLVWFSGGDAAAIYDRLWATPALDAIEEAHRRGAMIGGVSAGAMVWGVGTVSDFASLGEPERFPLFGWLDNLVIFAHYTPRRENAFRDRMAYFPGCRGLAIAHGGAVIIGQRDDQPRVLRQGSGDVTSVVLAGNDLALLPL